MKKDEIWVGIIPSVFGYGMTVISTSEAECKKALKAKYLEWKKSYPDPSTNFETSFEYYGGRIHKIEFGKVYFDDFSE